MAVESRSRGRLPYFLWAIIYRFAGEAASKVLGGMLTAKVRGVFGVLGLFGGVLLHAMWLLVAWIGYSGANLFRTLMRLGILCWENSAEFDLCANLTGNLWLWRLNF